MEWNFTRFVNLALESSLLASILISQTAGLECKNVKAPATLPTAGERRSKSIEEDLLVVMVTVLQTPD
jgi:hypothetical protein